MSPETKISEEMDDLYALRQEAVDEAIRVVGFNGGFSKVKDALTVVGGKRVVDLSADQMTRFLVIIRKEPGRHRRTDPNDQMACTYRDMTVRMIGNRYKARHGAGV